MAVSNTEKLVKLGQLATFKGNADNAYYFDVTYDSNTKKIQKVKKVKDASTGVWSESASDVVALNFDPAGQENIIETVKVNGTALTPASKAVDVTVALAVKSTANTGAAKTYQLKVNNVADPIEIDIPKDMVVSAGEVKTVAMANTPYTGAAVGDKYIELTIANASSSKLYIPVKDLVDVYTANNQGSKVQVAIDSSNNITASIVSGSIDKTDLASTVQASLNKADSALQADSTAFTGKADKVASAINNNFAALDANGNLKDSGKSAANFKPVQTAKTDPSASGDSLTFIATLSQDTDGVITATKKTVANAVASTSGSGGSAGLMTAAQAEKLDAIDFATDADINALF